MGFVVFVVIGLVLIAALSLPLGIALLAREERMQKRAEEHAPELLDEAFDGSPSVAIDVNARTMRYETVVIGARERGYALLSESLEPTTSTRTLIFVPAT